MFDWENLRFFLAVAQSGSLSAAARQLKVDHATVGRRLSALEAELETRLVDRLPRACQLTAAGRQLVEVAQRMEAEAFAIERLARAAQAPMSGKVTISVPPVLASNFFATTLRAFSQRHPGIQLAIASEAQRVSLGRREADLAVRLARPDEPRNVTRKLGTMPFALYASRDYAQAAQPAEWAFIAYEARLADMPHEQWLRAAAGERPVVCEVSDITTQLAVARTGVGVAGLPVFMGDADPALQRLPWSGEAFSRDIWLVVHDDLRHSPPIRAVIDFVVEVVGNTFKS